jgi:hypothetical protein
MMSLQLALAIMWATISSGHEDLADFCFLLAEIVADVAIVSLLLTKPVNLWRLCMSIAVALVTVGAFVM